MMYEENRSEDGVRAQLRTLMEVTMTDIQVISFCINIRAFLILTSFTNCSLRRIRWQFIKVLICFCSIHGWSYKYDAM